MVMTRMGSVPARPTEAAVQARIFRALQEIAVAAEGLVEMAPLARMAVDHARDLVGGWSSTLVWFDGPDQVRVLADNHPNVFPANDLDPGRGLSGQIRVTQDVVVVDDYARWEHAFDWAIQGGVKSMIGVPLKVRDEVLGCLLVRSDESNYFG